MGVCLSQWRAFKNHPCARQHTSCIYMCSLLSRAQSLSMRMLHFPSPVSPRALITKAVGAHLCESTRPWDRRIHTDAHASKQTSHQTTAASNSSVGGWGGWRSLLQANCRAQIRTQTQVDTLQSSQEDTLTENEASGLLSCLWMTVLIIWASSGPTFVCECVRVFYHF